MGTIAGYWTNYQIRLVQSLQIVFLLPAPHNNHRVTVTSQDKVNEQAGNAAVSVLKWMDTNIAIMEESGQFYRVVFSGGFYLSVDSVGRDGRGKALWSPISPPYPSPWKSVPPYWPRRIWR